MNKQSRSLALYRVGEAARLLGVSAGTLRAWERQGLAAARRSRGGHRLFSSADLARLTRVCRLRDAGANPAGIALLLSGNTTATIAAVSGPWGTLVGRKLRNLRRRRGLGLTDVGAKTGLSPSFVSMVERGLARPSMSTLRELCDVYGTTPRQLMRRTEAGDKQLVTARTRPLLGASRGVTIERLAEGNCLMDCQLFTVATGAGSGGAYAHDCEEFLFVLKGQLEIAVNGDRYRLHKGDSLYFKGSLPHQWRNPGGTKTSVIWINTPPASGELTRGS